LARSLPLAVAAALLAACSNPDNQVYGGAPAITATDGTTIPSAFIPNVASAIAGTVNITDTNNNSKAYTVVLLSNRNNLCQSLAARPDYFKNPPEAAVTLALFIAPNAQNQAQLGTFQVGATNGSAVTLGTTAGPGQPTYSYKGVGGSVALTRYDNSPGGESDGSFDLLLSDPTGQVTFEVFGKYKTSTCAAVANVSF
jgi:hypothetical protein